MKLTRQHFGGVSGLHYEPAQVTRPVSVLLTHGLTASAAGLDALSSYLAGHGFRVLAIDLPGHALGATGGRLTSARQAVGAVQLALTELPTPVVVGGHSFGAACSVVTARERAAVGVVVIALAPWGRKRFATPMGQLMRDQRSGYVAGAPLEDLLSDMHDLLEPSLDALQSLPFLVVGACQDLLVTEPEIRQWHERMPQATIEFVDGSHQDAPTAGRVVISRWLEEKFTS